MRATYFAGAVMVTRAGPPRTRSIPPVLQYCDAVGIVADTGDGRPLWVARPHDAVRIHQPRHRDARHLRARVVRQRAAHVDDRYVVRPIIGDDDLAPIGRPSDRERPCLARWVVRADPHAGELG